MVDKTFKIQELTEQALGSVLYIYVHLFVVLYFYSRFEAVLCMPVCSITAGLRLFCVYICLFVVSYNL